MVPYNVLYNALTFLHGRIQHGNKTSLVLFSDFKEIALFVFLVKIVRLYNLI